MFVNRVNWKSQVMSLLCGGMCRSLRAVFVWSVVFFCGGGAVVGADWAHWRGPDYDGISCETDWRSDGMKVLWRANVGTGFSSVAVSGGRVYTLGNDGRKGVDPNTHRDIVYCLDADDGKGVWEHGYLCRLEPKQYQGGPGATPAVDGGRVYTFSKAGDVFCLDAATGEVRWGKNLVSELGVKKPTWGFAGSPVVWGELLILSAGTSGVALNKDTGEVVWQNGSEAAGYSTAVPFKAEGKEMIALLDAKSLVGLEAVSGKIKWQIKWPTKDGFNMADPVIAGGELKSIFVSSGYRQGSAKIETGFDSARILWKNQSMRNHLATCVLIDGHLYGFDYWTLRCVDFESGQVKWSYRGLGQGTLTASADGRLIILGEKGKLVVARANSDRFDVISQMQAVVGKCWTVPVLSEGRIYVRNATGELVCLDVSLETN